MNYKVRIWTYILAIIVTSLLSLIISYKSIAQESSETVKDIHGNIYSTITFQNQVWMAENLKTTRFNDSTAIPLVENSSIWETTTKPGYCRIFNDESKNKKIGALYNWYAVETGKLCPVGWHVPTDRIYLEEASWPGGGRSIQGMFGFSFDLCSFWTSTEETNWTAYAMEVLYDGSAVNRLWKHKNTGLLVRCVRNKN